MQFFFLHALPEKQPWSFLRDPCCRRLGGRPSRGLVHKQYTDSDATVVVRPRFAAAEERGVYLIRRVQVEADIPDKQDGRDVEARRNMPSDGGCESLAARSEPMLDHGARRLLTATATSGVVGTGYMS